MVEVPGNKLGSQTTRAANPVYQSPSVPSGAFDNGASGLIKGGEQLGQFSDQLQSLAIQQIREDNDTEAKELENRIYEATRIATYGDPDTGVEGYYSKQNKQALDDYDQTETLLRAEVDTIIAESSNVNVRKRVFDSSRERLRDTVTRMTSHAEKQRVSYMNSVGEAKEALAFDEISKGYNDPTTRAKSLKTLETENTDWAIRNGVDPASDIAKARLLGRQGVATKGAFDAAMAAEDTVTAQRILSEAEAKGQADGALLATMKKDLQAETLAKRSQVVADEARRLYPGDLEKQTEYAKQVSSGKTRNAALDLLDGEYRRARVIRQEKQAEESDTRDARVQDALSRVEEKYGNIENAEQRDAAIIKEIRETLSGKDEEAALATYRQRQGDREALDRRARQEIDDRYKIENRARNEAVDAANKKAHAFLYGTEHDDLRDVGPGVPRTVSEFRRLYPDEYNTLVAGKAGSNQDFVAALTARQRDIQIGRLFAPATDGATLKDIRQMTLRERASLNLDGYRPKLTEAEYAEASRISASAKDRINANGGKLSTYNFGDSELKKYGRNVFGFGEKQKVKTKLFADASSLMTDFVHRRFQETGELPTPTEVTQEAIKLTLQVESDPSGGTFLFGFVGDEGNNSFSGIAAQASNMSPAQRREAIVPKEAIPDSIVQEVTNIFTKRKLNAVSEDDLQEFAGAIAMRDKTRMEAIIGRAKTRNNLNKNNPQLELTPAERTAVNAVYGGR